MGKKITEVVIPRDEAAFRLDDRGRWHGVDGEFLHPRIIDHFHRSIRKDGAGFHLAQRHGAFKEKVYFPYEDTPLFAIDLLKGENILLILNTKKRMKLTPRRLFIRGDHLYMHAGEDRVKFTEEALIKISPFLDFEEDRVFIHVKGERHRIPEL